jgi:hypothetical protein
MKMQFLGVSIRKQKKTVTKKRITDVTAPEVPKLNWRTDKDKLKAPFQSKQEIIVHLCLS